MREKTAVKNLTEKFLNCHYHFSTVWPYLPVNKKNNILEIIAEGRGVIPFQIIVDMESFFIKPDKEFWEKSEFFSELKLSALDDESYENSKYLYQSLKRRNLGDLNDLYNTQDVILLTEIIESRFQAMQNTYGFNPRKCNSACAMSGCIEKEMSTVILALPPKYEHVEIFEQTLIGGFRSINTRLAFDCQILLPNSTNTTNSENLKLNNEKVKKRVITKIPKLDENNQYGNVMIKPLPTGFRKDNKDISWEIFNFLLESVSFDDKIGHLYIVDI